MTVRMTPSPQRAATPKQDAVPSKNSAADSKSGFAAVLNSSNHAQKGVSKEDAPPNLLSHDLQNPGRRINDRKQFLNDSAEILGVNPFSFMPISDPNAGRIGLVNGAFGLRSSNQAHQVLSQVLNASNESRAAMNTFRLGADRIQHGTMTETSNETPLENQSLNKTDLKSALNQLKANSLMTRLAGASKIVKHSIAELSQQWGNEITSFESIAQESKSSFQSLSISAEHSPAEQLQAAVKAVASSFDGVDTLASKQNLVDGPSTFMSMNSPSSTTATNSAVRQPSMSLQLAMASHMDVELPQFATQLKRLSLQIQDPAGVMLLEIVKEAQELHVRAIIPQEAMDDLQNLESDIRQQLSQQGLDLGSFEMYSQGDQDSNGKKESVDSKNSSNTESKSDSIQLSDAILDRRI